MKKSISWISVLLDKLLMCLVNKKISQQPKVILLLLNFM